MQIQPKEGNIGVVLTVKLAIANLVEKDSNQDPHNVLESILKKDDLIEIVDPNNYQILKIEKRG